VTPEEDPRHGKLARNFVLVALVMGLVLVVDQLTKAFILDRLGPNGDRIQIKIIPGFLRLIYVENTGAAFGMFQGRSPVLTVLALVVIAFLIVYFRHSIARSVWLSIALGLQLGGALGNVVDRFRHGFVVDFINVPKWPTFNVADSAITVGVIMLGFYLLTRDTIPGSDDNTVSGTSGKPAADAPQAEEQVR
jgi:signal peptidase II